MIMTMPILVTVWVRGLRFLMRSDPGLTGQAKKVRFRELYRGVRSGHIPSGFAILGASRSYFRPGYHPSQEWSTTQAVDYLATSPAARAAHG
jgi:predicted metal-dependent hydrolase